MSECSKGPWQACNMVNEDGSEMTAEDIAEYVRGCVELGQKGQFLFITNEDGLDICHVGNGPKGPYNAELIAKAPEMAERIAHLEALCREVVEAARPYGNWKHDLVPAALTDKLRKEVE